MPPERAPRRLPAVFTLVLDEVPRRFLEQREGWLADQLVFRCLPDGRVTVDTFPDEIVVDERLVEHYAELAPGVLYLDRERLYIHAANGEAVYVPVGRSNLRHCTRYGRLYRRP